MELGGNMKILINSDSSCDLSEELIKKNNINIIPFRITLGEKEYTDKVDITNEAIFDYVKANKVLPKTSALNEYDFNEYFNNLRGGDENIAIIHFSISSKISSVYDHAVACASKMKNVYIIDSLSLSTGVGLQVLYACALRDRGLDAEEIVKRVNDRRGQVQASFVIDRMDYLAKGGRCPSIAAFGANLLGLKPSIRLTDGKMGKDKLYRGKIDKVFASYIVDTLQKYNSYDNSTVFITYSSAPQEMVDSAVKYLKENTTFKNIYCTTAGSTVASHCGPNTIGVLYYNGQAE